MPTPRSKPRSDSHLQRPRAAVTGTLIALGVWLLSTLGFLQPLTGWAYDQCFRMTFSAGTSPPPAVVLIEWDPNTTAYEEDVYCRTLAALEALGARQVVFTFLPEEASETFYRQAVDRKNVVLGRPILVDLYDPQSTCLADWPRAAAAETPYGVVPPPPVADGVCRQQYAYVAVGAETYPALEVAAAQRQSLSYPLPAERYYVNFRGGPGSLPHARLEAVLSDRLVPELVQGRTVLIGKASNDRLVGLFTPTARGGGPLSPLEYQGHALDTLLTGRAISPLGSVQALLLLVLTGSGGAALYHRLEARLAVGGSLLVLGACALVTALALSRYHCWLPAPELGLVQLSCLTTVTWRKADFSHRQIKRLVLDMSSGMPEASVPATFSAAPGHWALLVNLVTQTLDVNRLVFLDVVDGGRQLREAAVFNCPPGAIRETGRDCAGRPYRDALKVCGPVRVDNLDRPFFAPSEPGEQQYLAPIMFAGKVLSFWAIAVGPAEAADHVEALLSQYSEQMAELLYRRQLVAAGQRRGTLPQLLGSAPEEENCRALSRSVALAQGRLISKETLFAESSVPTVTYDLFGRVREVNPAMVRFLKGESLAASETSAVDVIAKLTGQDLPLTRRCLRRVILGKAPLCLPVKTAGQPGVFLLRVFPLPAGRRDALNDPAPFNVGGICCELLDRTTLVQLSRIKEKLTEELAVLLRNDLAALELSAGLLTAGDLSAAEREELAGIVSGKVAHMLDRLSACRQFLTVDVPGENDCFPIDARPLLDRAIDAVAPFALTRAVGIEVRQPDLDSYVLASPHHLQQAFEHVLSFLLGDARKESTATVRVEETAQWVTYSFANTGCGLSDGRFREYLFGEQPPASEEFQNLRNVVRWVTGWGGTVEAGSGVGEGVFVTVSLPRFG